MNASPLSAASSAQTAREGVPEGVSEAVPLAQRRRPWIFSLTGVCFLFGGLLAMQLRATQQINANQTRQKAGVVEAKQLAAKMKLQADASAKEREKLNGAVRALQTQIKNGTNLTAAQLNSLNAQIKDLQTVAGLTSIGGSGVRLTLSDNPSAVQNNPNSNLQPGWGLVHDYDLLQVVNELRSAKADAIAIHGAGGDPIRITGYTPIRCVGPVIYINWEPVAAPFTIEAVGNAATMRSALEMPNGIVDQLRNNGPVGVKVSSPSDLKLPPTAGGAPKLRVAKVIP